MKKIKQHIKDICFLAKEVDFVLLFISIFGIMCTLDYKLQLAIVAAYIYSAFYFILKRIITGQGVSILHLFLIFVLGILLIPGGVFTIMLFIGKGI